jgi:hypothetical protein
MKYRNQYNLVAVFLCQLLKEFIHEENIIIRF